VPLPAHLRAVCAGRHSTPRARLSVGADGRPLAAEWVRALLAHCLNLTVPAVDAGTYSTHSFRIGAVTAAASAGVPHDAIARTGRWQSLNLVRAYVTTCARCPTDTYAPTMTELHETPRS
jgi:hypothetical protein